MTGEWVELSELMVSRAGSVDPKKFVDEKFELFSIPAFDRGASDLVLGSEIGSNKQIVKPGDLMLSKIVPHIRRAWIVPEYRGHRQIASGEWILFRSPRIHGPYLRHLLTSDFFNRQFMQTVAGVGGSLLRARPSHVAKIRVPLPPLDEQRRLAAILDKADGLRNKRRQALTQLGGLTQSIFFSMFGGVTSERWVETHLEDLASTGSGGTPSRAKSENFGGTIPWIRSGDLGVDSITEAEVFITEVGLQTSSAKLVQPGAVLLAMYGATVGNSSILRIPATTNQAVCSIKCGPNLDPVFLLHFLRSAKMRIVAQGVGGAQPNISQGIIRKLRVPVVPLPMQIDFANRAGNVERLQERHRTQLVELNTLVASLQHRAFLGKL